jgi:lycopene cyclase domain-containing protein
MFTPPTYLGFLAVALLPPILALLWFARGGLTRPFVGGAGLVGLIGLGYTVPWDNALIARGVWWYGEGTVLTTIYLAPVGEYLFILLQPVLTALWVAVLRHRFGDREPNPMPKTAPTEPRNVGRADGGTDSDGPVRPARGVASDTPGWTAVPRRDRLLGAAAGLFVAAVGAVMLTAETTFYLGAILAWAGPVLAVQWAFGWRRLWGRGHRRLTALAVGVPTAHLAAADRVAIELGLWTVSPRLTTGLTVLGLPIEEGAFFLLTNVFVVQGLLLFLWVVEPAEDIRPAPSGAATEAS